MPPRNAWDPVWLFQALKFFHDQNQRRAESPQPDALAQDAGGWNEDWSEDPCLNTPEWPAEDWQPDDADLLGPFGQDNICGMDGGFDVDPPSPWI